EPSTQSLRASGEASRVFESRDGIHLDGDPALPAEGIRGTGACGGSAAEWSVAAGGADGEDRIRPRMNADERESNLTPCQFFHPLHLLHQELHVRKWIAAETRPIHAPLFVDQNCRMQLDIFEIVVGMKAARVGVIRVGEQLRG